MILKVYLNYEFGINDDYLVVIQFQGWCFEGYDDGICVYGGLDVLFMKVFIEMFGLMVVFFGYDYGDIWCYKWDEFIFGMIVEGNGINFCFG